jgi:hypothetical protein
MDIKRLFNTAISRILFKNILVFDLPKLGLTLNFPKYLWSYRKVDRNQFWFVNKENNQALIFEYFDDKIYIEEDIKNELNNIFSLSKIADFDAFLKCHRFIEYSTLEYSWIIIHSGIKFKFSCSISDKKSVHEKDNDYLQACSILNTLKISRQ